VGWKGPKYKKFATRSEAEAFVRGDFEPTKPGVVPKRGPGRPKKVVLEPEPEEELEEDDDEDEDEEVSADEPEPPPAAKRLKRQNTKNASIPEEGMGQDSVHSLLNASLTGKSNILVVYTDGSSLGNGRTGARAGLGVFFGKGDPR
jgi:ribonuclease HI